MTTKQELTEQLFEAINSNTKVETIEKLLNQGAKPNGRSEYYYGSPLHMAAACHGNEVTIKLLVKKGAKLNSIDLNKDTPLHTAVGENELGTTQLLLELGAKPSLKNKYGDTPLHIALREGDLDIVDALVEFCSKPNQPNEKGETPYLLALEADEVDIAMKLVDKTNIHQITKNGETALHLAARAHDLGSIKSLIELGAEVNARDENGATPLFRGAHSVEVVKLLLDNGADISAKREDGKTLFDIASNEVKLFLLEREGRQLLSVDRIMKTIQKDIAPSVAPKIKENLTNLIIQRLQELKA